MGKREAALRRWRPNGSKDPIGVPFATERPNVATSTCPAAWVSFSVYSREEEPIRMANTPLNSIPIMQFALRLPLLLPPFRSPATSLPVPARRQVPHPPRSSCHLSFFHSINAIRLHLKAKSVVPAVLTVAFWRA
jgi:hypothetical protein